ncbi:MAG: bifunctional pyr operon transcriptional regulator/uracil phosphoribosyltransferase PyrR [Clostridia bacterium]|nr:bifunctional pyr operon transcriptional regulator/uracil phosphoribosyltransferase PyrR [Clostridia bacterium]
MDAGALQRAISRISFEILERNQGAEQLCLIGIESKGPTVAKRIADRIGEIEGLRPPVGRLDVTPHRDDLRGEPPPDGSEISFSLDGVNAVLVDDVIYTGRTVRAAIDSIMEKGRPARIQLAVLIDRGHRELPIKPDYVGKNLPTSHSERVTVRLKERDGEDAVVIVDLSRKEECK